MAAEIRTGIRIDGNASGLTAAAASGEKALGGLRRETVELEKASSRTSGGLTGVQRAIGGVISAAAGWQLGRLAIATADDMTVLQSRLKLVTGNSNELAYVQGRLFAISQTNRAVFSDQAALYAQTARAVADLNISQERQLNLSESIAQAAAISGGPIESQRAAILQLSQGFASGTLRGEELNSVMEQTPRLAQAIAQGMGVSLGQLRALGQDGKLTAQTVIEALEKAAPALRREFEQVTPTISGAFTTLKNSSSLFISEFDKATGSSRDLAKGITSVADGIKSLAGSITGNSAAWSVLSGMTSWALGITAAGTATAFLVTRLGGLAALVAANPVVLTLLGIGAAAGAVVSGIGAVQNSNTGIQNRIDLANERVKQAEARIQQLLSQPARGTGWETGTTAERQAEREKVRDEQVKAIRDSIIAERNSADALRGELERRADPSREARDQFRSSERASDQRTEAAVLFPGAKPLEEVRKYAKLGVDIQREAYDQSVEIAKSYQNRIKLASSDAERVALTKEMNARLIQVDRDARREQQTISEQGAAQAKQLAEAQFGEKKARAELTAAFERNAVQQQVRTNEQLYRLGLVDVDAYYLRKAELAGNDLAITERLTTAELAQARAIAASARTAADKATAQARVLQLERELLELQGKQAAVRAEPGDQRAQRLKDEEDQLREDIFRARRASAVDGYNQADQYEQGTKDLQVNAIRDPNARARAQLDAELQQRRDRITAITDPDARQKAEDAFADYVVAKNAELAERLKPGYQQMLEDWADTSRQMRDTYNNTIEGMLRSGEDEFVRSGGNLVSTAKAIGQQIQQELLRMVYRQTIGKSVAGVGEKLLGGLRNLAGPGAGATTASGLGGGLMAELGSYGVFHTGGVLGREMPAARRVSAAAFKSAPRFHTGGIAGDEVPIIARKGEGIFTQAQMQSLAPVGANSTPTTVQGDTYNLTFHGGVSRSEVVAGMQAARQMAVADMVDGRQRRRF